MGAKAQTLTADLHLEGKSSSRGLIIIRAEAIKESNVSKMNILTNFFRYPTFDLFFPSEMREKNVELKYFQRVTSIF